MRSVYPLVFILLVTALVFSRCGGPENKRLQFFAPDSLAVFSVDINISKDTVLHTPGGAILHIPANAIQASGRSHAQLVIREAYTIADIVRAGLMTTSDGRPLSSGGMIGIETADGRPARLLKAIDVSLPTPMIQNGMKLYKGEMDRHGNLNWIDPRPLAKSLSDTVLETGESIFIRNCASCHKFGGDVIGPSLAYISQRRDKKWLADFIHNNQKVMAAGDRYANCLFEHCNRTPMNIFPALGGEELEALYRYINNESRRLGLPMPDDHLKKCVDSCERYDRASAALVQKRQDLIKDNGPRVLIDRKFRPDDTNAINSRSRDIGTVDDKVVAEHYQSEYYQFQINTLGWYNIDILLKETNGVKESTLMVRLQGQYTRQINVFLLIPSARVFAEGGLLEGKEKEYGFYTKDGRTNLPQGVKAIVLAMGEEKGQLLFSMASFLTSTVNLPVLEARVVSKETMNIQLKQLGLVDNILQVRDSKNAVGIRKVDKQLQALEYLKPKGCDCGCGILERGLVDTIAHVQTRK